MPDVMPEYLRGNQLLAKFLVMLMLPEIPCICTKKGRVLVF